MPICQRCGSYFSEKSCTCTPEDSEESPVTSVKPQETSTIRIIDPLKLLDSIENTEENLRKLEEEKGEEVQNLTNEITQKEGKESELQKEVDKLNSQMSELDQKLKNQQEEKVRLNQENDTLEQEIETLKAKISNLSENISAKEAEISNLKETLGE